MLRLLGKIFDRLLELLNYISVIAIFLTAIWIFGDVVGRFVLHRPIPGTTELVKTAILAIVFLGVAYTLKQGAHIRTTVLIRALSPRAKACLEVFGSFLGIVIFALLAIYGWEAAVKAWQVKEFEGVQLRVPTYPSRFIMVLGSALMVIQYGILLGRNFLILIQGREGGTQ
jgi:TRAP-type C4-dicarboxylate transport system permease small subunit